ncbi:MAG: hypothetical protein U0Q15_09850 [Kineosporiaceae bacterium]
MSPARPRPAPSRPALLLALALLVPGLSGCAGAGDVGRALVGLPPRVEDPVATAAPAGNTPEPAAAGGPTVQAGGHLPARPRGPRAPAAPRRPASPSAPEPPGEDPGPRFEPPRPSNAPSPQFRRDCPQGNDGTSNLPSRVTPGTGSLTVTFWNPGARDAVSLQVIAWSASLRAGTQAAPVTVTVAAPAQCREVTATVPGLRRGDRYQVWVEQTNRSPLDGRLRSKVVARTETVTVG